MSVILLLVSGTDNTEQPIKSLAKFSKSMCHDIIYMSSLIADKFQSISRVFIIIFSRIKTRKKKLEFQLACGTSIALNFYSPGHFLAWSFNDLVDA